MADRFEELHDKLQAGYTMWRMVHADDQTILDALLKASEAESPRETLQDVRMASLEAENERLSAMFLKYKEDGCSAMSKLEAENAALRTQLDDQNAILGEVSNTPQGAIIAALRKMTECGCGDIRPASEMCHLCGKCQTGCCMCVSATEANAMRGRLRDAARLAEALGMLVGDASLRLSTCPDLGPSLDVAVGALAKWKAGGKA